MRVMKMGESKFDVPQGFYRAKFLGVEDVNNDMYGPGLKWSFEITDGAYRGKTPNRTTGLDPSTKSQCGKMLAALAGGSLLVGSEVNIDQYVGRYYEIVVEANSTGKGTRIGSILPPRTAEPPQV